MCLGNTVGRGGRNERADVARIQLLLNLNRPVWGGTATLAVDGAFGARTQDAIQLYQRALRLPESGLVAPGDAVMAAFRAALPRALVRETLWATMVTAPAARIDTFFAPVAAALTANGIDTPLRRAHFLAQVGHESLDLRYQEEIADGRAYEGRADLGNTQPGDGPRFKGRGLIQLTGRANYTAYGRDRGRDFVTGDNPGLIASDPRLAVDVACWFWTRTGLNALADRDDVEAVTRRINGGLNGLDDRKARLAVAKWFMVG